jgi:signal transduction histidine kinase
VPARLRGQGAAAERPPATHAPATFDAHRALRGRSGPSSATADGELIRRTRRRLVAWSGGLTLVILVVLGVAVASVVARSLAATGEDQLRQRASLLLAVARGPLPIRSGGPRGGELGLAFGGPTSGTFGMLVAPDDSLVEPSVRLSEGFPVQASVDEARETGLDVREIRIDDVPVRIMSVAVERAGGTYVVQVVADRSAEERTLQVLYLVLAVGGLAALALALVGGRIYAERALQPIRSSLARQRDFAADASHELRTPLSVVRSSVDHLLRNPERRVGDVGTALSDISAEVDRLSAMVGDLLLLARADSGALELSKAPLDLADLATTALADLQPIAAQRHVALQVDAVPGQVLGDADRLRQLVTILVDNAIRHSPAGGTVTVRVRRAGKRVALQVEDQGPGIREEDRPHLFERFWRAPGAPEGGSGLGLAIAAWIVEAHEGKIQAGNRPEGGARFEVDLPAAEG